MYTNAMSDSKLKETQQELFTEFSPVPRKQERFPSLAKTQKPLLLTTNTEQLLLTGIVSILVFCGVFFLGVLRGKAISHGLAQPPAVYASPRRISRPPAQNILVAATLRTPQPQSIQPIRNVQFAARPVAVQTAPVATQPIQNMQHATISNDTNKPYTIQLLTHRKKELAEGEVKNLKLGGFFSFIIPSGEYYQVCVGQYASKEEARLDLGRFLTKYKDCFLRRK